MSKIGSNWVGLEIYWFKSEGSATAQSTKECSNGNEAGSQSVLGMVKMSQKTWNFHKPEP